MGALIAWKPVGGPEGGSARYRAFLPQRYLKEAGLDCEIYDPAKADRYELVVFQKVYDQETLGLVRRLRGRGVKTVFDLCDNLFHYGLDNPDAARRRGEQLREMLTSVDAVSVSTPELGRVIEERVGAAPAVIDDVVEAPAMSWRQRAGRGLRNLARAARGRRPFRVVWYGTSGSENPPFGLIDLRRVLPALEELHRETPLSVSVISNSVPLFERYTKGAGVPFAYYEWSTASFPYFFKGHDVCILPVNANPMTVCKTNNRLVLSLLLGVPVVADPIPSYEEFGDFVLFSDWRENLRRYAADPGLRRRHVRQGRAYIRSRYNPERVVSQWSALFRSLLG